MTAITETMRKPLSNQMYKVMSSQQQSRYDDIQYYKAASRTRSRSHTPEPIYKTGQDETKQLASVATRKLLCLFCIFLIFFYMRAFKTLTHF